MVKTYLEECKIDSGTMNTALALLFAKLNNLAVQYCLLTDFESDFLSKDIDLFVHSDSRQLFENTLLQCGWYKRKEPAHHINHHFYFSPQSDVYLDVKFALSFANQNHQCFTYHFAEEAISRTVLNNKGIYRPADQDAVILYAAHLAYKERGRLEEKHRSYLSFYLNAYRSIKPPFDCVISAIATWLKEDFPLQTPKLQELLKPFFCCSQKKMVRSKSYPFGLGVKVLFLGTDGAGKTTLIEAVGMKSNLKTSRLYLGVGENGWTSPVVKSLYNYQLKIKLLNKVFSFFKTYMLLPAEFTLRILKVKIKSRYSVVLIDRVPGTVFLEKNRIKRFLYQSLLPKPDIVFFLYADPFVLQKRKPHEITLEQSKADIIKFQKVASIISGGNYISIDTSQKTISETRDLVFSEIYKNSRVYEKLLTTRFN